MSIRPLMVITLMLQTGTASRVRARAKLGNDAFYDEEILDAGWVSTTHVTISVEDAGAADAEEALKAGEVATMRGNISVADFESAKTLEAVNVIAENTSEKGTDVLRAWEDSPPVCCDGGEEDEGEEVEAQNKCCCFLCRERIVGREVRRALSRSPFAYSQKCEHNKPYDDCTALGKVVGFDQCEVYRGDCQNSFGGPLLVGRKGDPAAESKLPEPNDRWRFVEEFFKQATQHETGWWTDALFTHGGELYYQLKIPLNPGNSRTGKPLLSGTGLYTRVIPDCFGGDSTTRLEYRTVLHYSTRYSVIYYLKWKADQLTAALTTTKTAESRACRQWDALFQMHSYCHKHFPDLNNCEVVPAGTMKAIFALDCFFEFKWNPDAAHKGHLWVIETEDTSLQQPRRLRVEPYQVTEFVLP